MRILTIAIALSLAAMTLTAQVPPIEPGVPHELAKWRAAHYSDIRYELDLTLEKMTPMLKGKLAIEVEVRSQKSGVREEDRRLETGDGESESLWGPAGRDSSRITRYSSILSQFSVLSSQSLTIPIVLDWRRISGHEKLSRVFNVKINGKPAEYEEVNEHLVFRKGVVERKNRIELEFESPILTSGGAITRYVDKEDGSEYIYSLFVPSDASTAFPVFDQPDLKAKFELFLSAPPEWKVVSNSVDAVRFDMSHGNSRHQFLETKPISTYVFAFAAGPFSEFVEGSSNSARKDDERKPENSTFVETEEQKEKINKRGSLKAITNEEVGELIAANLKAREEKIRIFVRRSQAQKFKKHRAETIRLNREAIEYLEDYFDYPFPFPKYDVVLIPEFPFGGMEHAGATFLRETSVIFPTEPTANNYIARASVIFHEAAHQWFGDTVTMKWFDDLWLKEGFATFMAYKTMEKVLPEYDPWKVFYHRVKPTAYATDVTKGTVPIYQDIPNLNSAKSAYGAIVYQKAPSFLRQAEFYLGEDKFKRAVRSFLKDNEYANAEWSDLVGAFEKSSGKDLGTWATAWVARRGLPIIRVLEGRAKGNLVSGSLDSTAITYSFSQTDALGEGGEWPMAVEFLQRFSVNRQKVARSEVPTGESAILKSFAMFLCKQSDCRETWQELPIFVFPNYRDYGYGIFLLDEKSRTYILKNIRTEKDEFLRAQMWGSLWDSVRFAELAPLDYLNLAIANIDFEKDETTISSILGRTAYAYTYYLSEKQRDAVAWKLEALLIEKMHNTPTVGQRITYFRALLGVAKGEKARTALKELFRQEDGRPKTKNRGEKTEVRSQESEIGTRSASDGQKISTRSGSDGQNQTRVPSGDTDAGEVARGPSAEPPFPIRPKDRFDIAARLIEVGDPDGAKMLAELEKTENDDAALRWAYAAKAGVSTAENKAKYWKDFTENKEISESWIEEAFGVWNSPSHAELTLSYLDDALAELPALKRNRKIFFVNNWLGSFIGGQKSEEALKIVNRFLDENPNLDADLRRKILENVDGLERAVKIRAKFGG
ncbi:MAG TPA: M1 family aminopeptidase [Aridibacter sp.]|nr:M1 family aminopeptidase [Aridibacter sp.]